MVFNPPPPPKKNRITIYSISWTTAAVEEEKEEEASAWIKIPKKTFLKNSKYLFKTQPRKRRKMSRRTREKKEERFIGKRKKAHAKIGKLFNELSL